jgi:hypothetical protein
MSTFSRSGAVMRGTATRENAFRAEFGDWMGGTLVFGRGLSYYQNVDNPEDDARHIAFGHLGYVTYLSQLGLIGLLVYGIYFPLSIIHDGRFLWRHALFPAVRYLGLLTTASVLSMSIAFVMSSSFLAVGVTGTGAIYGAAWSMARRRRSADRRQPLGVEDVPTFGMEQGTRVSSA